MTSIGDKVDHVKRARQSRDHTCHWPGCTRQVKPALWGCLPHWRALPPALRGKIWAAYRPGQENDLKPSVTYLGVAREVQAWIAANHPPAAEQNRLL